MLKHFARVVVLGLIVLDFASAARGETDYQNYLKAAYCINAEEKPLAEMLANTAANLEKTAAKLTL